MASIPTLTGLPIRATPKEGRKLMSTKSGSKSVSMTIPAASRIQSQTAKSGGGQVQAGSFAARAQRAATLNPAAGKVSK